jgi:hypothetical protein
MDDNTPFVELRVPRRRGALAPTIAYSLGLLFTLVAAGNLIYYRHIRAISLIASLLWLLFVSWIVVSNVRQEGGVSRYLVNRLGDFSPYHFIRATPPNVADTISIGYLLFDRPLPYLTIHTKAISSIEWCTGQATAMSGRDMNDWHVVLWHHHSQGPQRKPFPGVRDEEVFIIGPFGHRSTIESFGIRMIEFLKGVGVELTPGKDEREFNTPSRCKSLEQPDEREPA